MFDPQHGRGQLLRVYRKSYCLEVSCSRYFASQADRLDWAHCPLCLALVLKSVVLVEMCPIVSWSQLL